MTFAELLIELRVEISDTDKTEWTDTALMAFINRALKRLHSIIIRNELPFALMSEAYTVEDTDLLALPATFMVQHCLYRQDTGKKLQMLTDDRWERMSDPGDGAWRFVGTDIQISSNIPEDCDLKLYYFQSYQRESDVQEDVIYGDEIWDNIIVYAAFLSKNVDEFDMSIDTQILSDIESQMIMLYSRNVPQVARLEP